MKKFKKNDKGFTLVELIVVLVILAILAAILVPSLLGYINKAKSEKNYDTAQSVHTAVQALLTEQYGKDTGSNKLNLADIQDLVGAESGKVTAVSYTTGSTTLTDKAAYQVTGLDVTVDGHIYEYTGGQWSVVTTSALKGTPISAN